MYVIELSYAFKAFYLLQRYINRSLLNAKGIPPAYAYEICLKGEGCHWKR